MFLRVKNLQKSMSIKITKQQSDSKIAVRLLDELDKIIDDGIIRMEDVIYNRDETLTYEDRVLIGSRILREILPMDRSVSDDYMNLLVSIEEVIKDVRELAARIKKEEKKIT